MEPRQGGLCQARTMTRGPHPALHTKGGPGKITIAQPPEGDVSMTGSLDSHCRFSLLEGVEKPLLRRAVVGRNSHRSLMHKPAEERFCEGCNRAGCTPWIGRKDRIVR